MARNEASVEATEENGLVTIRFFDGRTFEIDFKQTPWASRKTENLVAYISDIMDRFAFRGLEMTGLPIRPIFKPPIT